MPITVKLVNGSDVVAGWKAPVIPRKGDFVRVTSELTVEVEEVTFVMPEGKPDDMDVELRVKKR